MPLKITQWNINGFINNYNQLSLLIKDNSPDIICLQETHLPNDSNSFVCPEAYLAYFCNLPHNTSAKKGIGVLIKRHIPHTHKQITSNILCSALQLNLDRPITIINM